MLKNIKVGLGITGSFCNFSKVKPEIDLLKEAGVTDILPIVSYSVLQESTRFGKPEDIIGLLRNETKKEIIDTISKAEPIGPKDLVDIIVVAPCTGNTLAKLANGITDTPILMAVKSHIRNNKPVVLGISSNDLLGMNGENLTKLINTKNFYFIPFNQDNHINKPKSLAYDYTRIVETMECALKGEQIQPVLLK